MEGKPSFTVPALGFTWPAGLPPHRRPLATANGDGTLLCLLCHKSALLTELSAIN